VFAVGLQKVLFDKIFKIGKRHTCVDIDERRSKKKFKIVKTATFYLFSSNVLTQKG
jgi:hypothetical protein